MTTHLGASQEIINRVRLYTPKISIIGYFLDSALSNLSGQSRAVKEREVLIMDEWSYELTPLTLSHSRAQFKKHLRCLIMSYVALPTSIIKRCNV